MTHTMRSFAFSILGLLLVSPLAMSQAGDRPHGQRDGPPRQRLALRHERRARLLDRIQWTDAQRELALQQARAAQPIVARARRDRERIRIEAREAARSGERSEVREAARAQLRALRDSRRSALEPLARPLLAALTPEQRRTLEELAAKRGRTLSEEQLMRRIERVLARRRTVPKLEAQLGR